MSIWKGLRIQMDNIGDKLSRGTSGHDGDIVTAREKFIDNVNLFGKADCGASGKSLGYV